MSQRDELANLIDEVAEQAHREGRICSPLEVADAILAADYVKADGEEIRLRVVGTDRLIGDPWTDIESARGAAEYINKQGMNNEREAVRRLVGPWEVA